MLIERITTLAEDLEKQELEAENGIATPQLYQQLLAIYLSQNDLCNAKYLWKRVPANIKQSTPELASIWSVAQCMWKRDFPGTYKALSAVKWSDTVAEIMKLVQDNVRSRAVDLISKAYSSISLGAVAQMTGLPEDVTHTACVERGWSVEADTNMVHPVRSKMELGGHISNEDQLHRLTDFVSYLEN